MNRRGRLLGIAGLVLAVLAGAPGTALAQTATRTWAQLSPEVQKAHQQAMDAPRGLRGTVPGADQRVARVLQRTEQAMVRQTGPQAAAYGNAVNGGRVASRSLPKLVGGRALPALGAFTLGWEIGTAGRKLYIASTTPAPPAAQYSQLLHNGDLDNPRIYFQWTTEQGFPYAWISTDYPQGRENGCSGAVRPPAVPAAARTIVGETGGCGPSQTYEVPTTALRQTPPSETKPGGGFPDSPSALTMPTPLPADTELDKIGEFYDSPEGEPLRKQQPWIEEQADTDAGDENGQLEDADVEESPEGDNPAPQRLTVPEPAQNETAQQYNDRLQQLGFNPAIRTRTSYDQAREPDEITGVSPAPGTKHAPGTPVEIEKNPSTRPSTGTDPAAGPGAGDASESCPATAVRSLQFGPLTNAVPMTRFPFGVVGWILWPLNAWPDGVKIPELSVPIPGVNQDLTVSMKWFGSARPILYPLMLVGGCLMMLYAAVAAFLPTPKGQGAES